MNETITSILKRRSVREYSTKAVAQTELDQILEAGRNAPTAMNQQPWHFTVICNRELLRKLEEQCKTAFLESSNEALRDVASQEGFSVFYQAPLLILISADRTALAPQYDSTLAMGNMMVAAASLGIGSCWTHAAILFHATTRGKDAYRELGIVLPEHHELYAAAGFGYPSGDWPETPPKRTDCVTIME
ncbi:MAG: nitroreductase [Chlorobiales bacterium]|nr:nitroreductase [Chlorobiales bacterium]